jgi:hypothetical protein
MHEYDRPEGIPMAQGASWRNEVPDDRALGIGLAVIGGAIAVAFLALQAMPSQRQRRQIKRTIRQVSRLHDREPARTA